MKPERRLPAKAMWSLISTMRTHLFRFFFVVLLVVTVCGSACSSQRDGLIYPTTPMSGTAPPLLFGTTVSGNQCPIPSALLAKALEGFGQPDPSDEAPPQTLDEYRLRVHELTLQYRDPRAPLPVADDLVVVATIELVDEPTRFEALADFAALGISANREVSVSAADPAAEVRISSWSHDAQSRYVSYAEVEAELIACDARTSYFFPAIQHRQILKVLAEDEVCSVFPFDRSEGVSEGDLNDCLPEADFFEAIEEDPGV